MSIQIYGIPNCGTCKKAFKWLQENGIDYEFINTKETPPTREMVQNWVTSLGSAAMGITVPKRENCTLRLKRLQDNDFRTKINWLANTCIISNWKIAYPHSLGAE